VLSLEYLAAAQGLLLATDSPSWEAEKKEPPLLAAISVIVKDDNDDGWHSEGRYSEKNGEE
jgi:hypothetical protein